MSSKTFNYVFKFSKCKERQFIISPIPYASLNTVKTAWQSQKKKKCFSLHLSLIFLCMYTIGEKKLVDRECLHRCSVDFKHSRNFFSCTHGRHVYFIIRIGKISCPLRGLPCLLSSII